MPGAALEETALRLMELALAQGAEAADVVAAESESVSVETREGSLEHAERAEAVEIGLRVLIGRRQACVSASDLRDETLHALVERGVAMAGFAPEDPYCGLADPEQLAPVSARDASGLMLEDPAGPPPADVLEAASLAAERAALSVGGVTRMDGAGASWGRTRISLAASNGFVGGYARSHATIFASAIAGEGVGMERDHAAETRRFHADLPDPETVGRLAGERAVSRLAPRKAKTGAAPVLYDQRIAASLVSHLTGAANGASIGRGSSWLQGKLGAKILPDSFSLIEEPHRISAPGSRPFDGEGLATQRREIVADGTLQGWTLDLASGRKLGMPSTANAGRGMSSPPTPSLTNIRLDAPRTTREALIASMGTGLLVTSLMGASINPTTGDYSRGASGFWVENGEIAYPVNELTIAGNLLQMLSVLEAADDEDPHRGALVPSLLIPEGLTIAGG